MQLKIYINDKIWKTVPLQSETYNPNDYWRQLASDKAAGLLNSFNVAEGMKVEFRKVN